MITKLDESQLSELILKLNQTNWSDLSLNFFAQLIAVGVAAFSGYLFQKKFLTLEKNEVAREQAYKFNEAVVYIASLLESTSLHIHQLVLESHAMEKARFAELKKKRAATEADAQTFNASFYSIRPMEVASPENFLSKIPDVGIHTEIIQVFNRMRGEMLQFNAMCEERLYLIKEFLHQRVSIGNSQEMEIRYSEVLDRTSKLVISGEAIFDAEIFLSRSLEKVAISLKGDLKKKKMKGVKVVSLERNNLHEVLRLQLRDIVDQFPTHIGRMLHIPRDEQLLK